MIVRYSCPLCGLIDATYEVFDRRDDEDLMHWFNFKLLPALYLNHIQRVECPSCLAPVNDVCCECDARGALRPCAPHLERVNICRPKMLHDLKIPLPLGISRVGSTTVEN